MCLCAVECLFVGVYIIRECAFSLENFPWDVAIKQSNISASVTVAAIVVTVARAVTITRVVVVEELPMLWITGKLSTAVMINIAVTM